MDELFDERVVGLAAQPGMAPAEVQVIGEERGVVGAHVEADRQRARGMDAGGGGVERELAHRDGHAAGALVAEAEDALVVGDDDEPHVLEGRVAEHAVDLPPVVGRDPQAAGAAEDVAELLARAAHRGRVDDGEELLEMVDEEPVEEGLVPVLQGGEADVALEGVALARDVAVGAPRLLLERAHGVGQQALEPERAPLLARERGALVVHGVAQELGAPVGYLQPRHAIRARLEAITLHDPAMSD